MDMLFAAARTTVCSDFVNERYLLKRGTFCGHSGDLCIREIRPRKCVRYGELLKRVPSSSTERDHMYVLRQ